MWRRHDKPAVSINRYQASLLLCYGEMKQNSHVLELNTSSVTVRGNTSSYKTVLNEPSDSLEDKVSDGSLYLQLSKICCHKSFEHEHEASEFVCTFVWCYIISRVLVLITTKKMPEF